MKKIETLFIIPANDPEAILIIKLVKALSLPLLVLNQPHGASLDKEKDIVSFLKKGTWKQVVIVETPGIKTEKQIQALGISLHIIDHHHYTDLDRAHDPQTGEFLPSSLEQFLKYVSLTDKKLKQHGFNPKMVRGVGIMDRGFIWALKREGYNESEIQKVVQWEKELFKETGNYNEEKEHKREQATQNAWKKRTIWKTFFVVKNSTPLSIRGPLSLLIALEQKKRTSLILCEPKRGAIYVQESPYGMDLFKTFGGFTFGMDKNWGYRNEKGKRKIGLREVKKVLETLI